LGRLLLSRVPLPAAMMAMAKFGVSIDVYRLTGESIRSLPPLRQSLTKTSLLIDTRMTASADGSGAAGGILISLVGCASWTTLKHGIFQGP